MDAVICFNDDVLSRRKVFEAIPIYPGCNVEASLGKIDRVVICKAELTAEKVSKEARMKKSIKKQCRRCINVRTE